MATHMRAKVQVQRVTRYSGTEELVMTPVSGKTPYGPNGESEDNTFARYTPAGEFKLSITNPSLIGWFNPGETFYVDFTPADLPLPPAVESPATENGE